MRLRNRLCSSPVFVLFPLHLTLQSILVVLPFCDKTCPFGKPLLLSRDNFSHLRETLESLEQLGQLGSQLGSSLSWVRPGVMKTMHAVSLLWQLSPCPASSLHFSAMALS